MTMRWLLFLPPVAQLGALAVWWFGWPASTTVGMNAQFAAAFVTLVAYGAFVIHRLRFLRHTYNDLKRRRAEQGAAFQSFVDAHLPPFRR